MSTREWLSIHGAHRDVGLEPFGGKFGGLAVLAANREFVVPPGLGLSAETVQLIESSPNSVESLLEREVIPQLRLERQEFGESSRFVRLAVRSSANLEDGHKSGFPGVFHTETNVEFATANLLEASAQGVEVRFHRSGEGFL